jgi:pilus assembly protein CpaB
MKFLLGLLAGLGAGIFVAGLLGGAVGYAMIKRAESNARRGWNLVPVVVAARDIPGGEVVTFDAISQRAVPEQFVTSSWVRPDSASYVVNLRTMAPLKAGDGLAWSYFEGAGVKDPLQNQIAIKACERELAQASDAFKPDRTAEAIRARLKGGAP